MPFLLDTKETLMCSAEAFQNKVQGNQSLHQEKGTEKDGRIMR